MDGTSLESTAVQKLGAAIVECHEPKLLEAEDELKELTVKQDLLLGELQKQNRRLEDAVGRAKVDEMVNQTKVYFDKLTGLKREMDSISERVQRIKKRALKLQQQKHHEALLREQAKDRELEREKQLIARPAKRN